MLPRLSRIVGFTLAAGLAMLLVAEPGRAQVVVKVNDVVNFRLGIQLQPQAEWLQDPISKGYQQDFFFRRARFYMAGNIAKNVSFLFDTDVANLGKSSGTLTKDLSTGIHLNDAFGEWKVLGNDLLILDVGKMLPPFTRNSLQSTSSHLALDSGTWTFLQGGPLQNDAARDLGFQIKNYLVDDHLELRYALFDGFRAPAPTGAPTSGSRNPFRFTGRAVYNFWDTEKGYVPVGTNLGKKSILAIGGGYDTQGGYTSPATATTPEGHGYKAYGADFMIDRPFGPGDAKTGRDALTAHFDFIHFDGGCRPNAAGIVQTNCLIPALPRQDEYFTDLGWYFHAIDLQPFVRYEELRFRDETKVPGNIRRYMGGFNYYVTPGSQTFKITGAFERIVPRTQGATATTKNTNHFLLQFQFYYF